MTTFPVPLPGATADTLLWAHPDEIEPAAADQLRRISDLPWVERLRVMPDVHLGRGATVGSVIGMRDAVSPSAVGVDIGCGMAAVKTSLGLQDLPEDLRALRSSVENAIPVGFNAHNGTAGAIGAQPALGAEFDRLFGSFVSLRAPRIAERGGRAMAQCGTLGGGNHFLEVTADDEGAIWLMLHSGSRNIGNELAQRHIEAAKTLDHNLDLPDRDLAVFLAGTAEMEAYLHDLYWAQDYARLNRAVMMALFRSVLAEHFPQVQFGREIQCHHNYVAVEHLSDGTELIVTRKGAIRAGEGDLGLIPGSMGTGSFVVRGLGSETSLWSASHGAGRRMSRTKAKRTFTVEDLQAQTAGVECRKDRGVLDEIPGAYKDLDAVIAAQSDLVEVVTRLTTLLCVKG